MKFYDIYSAEDVNINLRTKLTTKQADFLKKVVKELNKACKHDFLVIKQISKQISYYRQPTAFEIRKGYGAIHYKDFDMNFCTKKNGEFKRWLICPIDGLRYSRY